MFFNGGSTYDMYGNPATTCMFAMRKNGPAKIMMNTFLSATISGIIVVYVKPHVTGTYSHVSRYDCHACTNGVLCGLVAITGCCDVVEPWFAFVIGIIAAFFYMLGCKVTELLKIDQPCESSAVHMFGGIWGCIATGLFSNDQGLFFAHGGGRFFGV
jgi:Amt family ammonium transporter